MLCLLCVVACHRSSSSLSLSLTHTALYTKCISLYLRSTDSPVAYIVLLIIPEPFVSHISSYSPFATSAFRERKFMKIAFWSFCLFHFSFFMCESSSCASSTHLERIQYHNTYISMYKIMRSSFWPHDDKSIWLACAKVTSCTLQPTSRQQKNRLNRVNFFVHNIYRRSGIACGAYIYTIV